MNLVVKIFVGFMLFVITKVNAQNFQGVATYKTKRQVSIKLDSTQVGSSMQKQLQEMLKKQFEKTYILVFNREESLYNEEVSLGAPVSGGMQVISTFSGGGGDVLYKNTKNKTYTDQNEFLGKIFLIQDQLKPIAWELGSETKNIGTYTCFKATITDEVEVFENKLTFNREKNNKENSSEPKMKTRVTTAWYTPQISVSNGPEQYFGLPGLILEINDGQQTIVCSKIVLNPDEKIEIEAPTKGKKVSQKEFEEISLKKIEEMNERNGGAPGRDGETMRIRIGG